MSEENKSSFSLDSSEKEPNMFYKSSFLMQRSSASTQMDTANKFDVLVDTVFANFTEVQTVVQDLLKLKDELLTHFLPPPLLFKIAVIFGKVYRTFSDLNTPVNEMLRLVKIYSASWEKNSQVLKRLHEAHESKKHMLNIAIKRLAMVEKKSKLFDRERRILNWERLFVRLTEAKGHGRRWKFQMDAFRKKANEGYDDLVRWVLREPDQPPDAPNDDDDQSADKSDSLLKKVNSRRDKKDRRAKNNLDDTSSMKSFSDEIGKKNDDNDIIQVESDQELFSEANSELGAKKKSTLSKEVAEVNTQTEPDVDDKTTWTGEPSYRRFFIVRLFKPAEFNAKKFKCRITFAGQTFESKIFEPLKKVKINEFPDEQPKSTVKKPGLKNLKNTVKREAPSGTLPPPDEEKKIDTTKYQDFLFEMSDFVRQKEVLSTNTDNSIAFEVVVDEKDDVKLYSMVQMDDVHTLDLPILYYKLNEDAEVVDHYEEKKEPKQKEDPNVVKAETASSWLRTNDMTLESVEKYDMLSKRAPFTFNVCKEKTLSKNAASVAKLPVIFFWLRKPFTFARHKNTGTASIRDLVTEMTGIDLDHMSRGEIEKFLQRENHQVDKSCSPINSLPSYGGPQRPPSTPLGSVKTKRADSASQQKEIEHIHENYQFQIDQLNLTILRQEDEIAQLKALSELKSDSFKYKSRFKLERLEKSSIKSSEKSIKEQPTSNKQSTPKVSQTWNKEAHENFLRRLKMFAERSDAHHKELFEKYFSQEAALLEQKMAVQHRLDQNQSGEVDNFEDFCLPAVFMPYKSPNNVYNPRAYQYFHPSGSNDVRITQPPTVFQLPPLPSRPTLSVINLYELGKRYEAGEPDYLIKEFVNRGSNKKQQPPPPGTSEQELDKSIQPEHHGSIENLDTNTELIINQTN